MLKLLHFILSATHFPDGKARSECDKWWGVRRVRPVGSPKLREGLRAEDLIFQVWILSPPPSPFQGKEDQGRGGRVATGAPAPAGL